MTNVLILGGAGYIGTRLHQVLTKTYYVESIDVSTGIDYYDLTIDQLAKYNAIILLAGHSSVQSCIGELNSPWLNNVTNFQTLLDKISKEQLLIYASSASIYGNNVPGKQHTENKVSFRPVNHYDVTKYALDLTAQLAIHAGHKVIGLRFGTVNGWSPVLRTDLMINAMYHTAVTTQQITVTNKHINRALLGIEDLCRAMGHCIENPIAGIYNLASFNTTVGTIAQIVSDRLMVPVVDLGNTDGAYDFELDCSKFESSFNFQFTETPATIVDGLITHYTESNCVKRNEYISYKWR